MSHGFHIYKQLVQHIFTANNIDHNKVFTKLIHNYLQSVFHKFSVD